MSRLITAWFGVRRVEGKETEEERLFPADAAAVADRLERIRDGRILDEERKLAAKNTTVTDPRLSSIGTLKPHESAPWLSLPDGFDLPLLRAATLTLARKDVALGGADDRMLAHAVRVLDELLQTTNTLTERVREWHHLLDPLDAATADGVEGSLERIAGKTDEPDGASSASGLMDATAVGSVARSVIDLVVARDRLEKRIEASCRKVAPTLAAVIGPIIGARLISVAGSLERLASLPASTVQTLGAETSLFNHLRHGTPPPKHGVLFQHPLINTSPRRIRGRMARMLASKAVVAARADCFVPDPDGNERAEKLAQSLARQAEAIKKAPKATAKRQRPARRVTR